MRLRAATVDDLEALVDVQEEGAVRGLSHSVPPDDYPFPRERVLGRWKEEVADPRTYAYVSTDDEGAVTGFAATRGNEALNFGTKVETWGTGHALEVHDALLENLAGTAPAGTTHARLRVFEANLRARRFYQKLGWNRTEDRTQTSFPPHPTLLEYQRRLGA